MMQLASADEERSHQSVSQPASQHMHHQSNTLTWHNGHCEGLQLCVPLCVPALVCVSLNLLISFYNSGTGRRATTVYRMATHSNSLGILVELSIFLSFSLFVGSAHLPRSVASIWQKPSRRVKSDAGAESTLVASEPPRRHRQKMQSHHSSISHRREWTLHWVLPCTSDAGWPKCQPHFQLVRIYFPKSSFFSLLTVHCKCQALVLTEERRAADVSCRFSVSDCAKNKK